MERLRDIALISQKRGANRLAFATKKSGSTYPIIIARHAKMTGTIIAQLI